VIVRWGIRLAASLVGIAAGIVLSAAILSGVHVSASGLVVATLVFWVVHIVVSFLALRVLVRQPSLALAGLLAVASTIASLIVVSLVVSDLSIRGMSTYFFATLVIWATTAIGDLVGTRMIRARRHRD
jgi:hypothetical protein